MRSSRAGETLLLRMERRLGFGAVVIALAILALPSFAEAQAWLDDRARAEGPGFQLGDFELHPGLGVEVGYDSNLYYSDDETLPAVDTGILRTTAHLLLSTRGPQRRTEGEAGGDGNGSGALPTVTFRGGLSGSFYHFFADENQTNMEVDASLALGILPGRPFSINLYEELGRSIRPFTENPRRATSYGRVQNTAGVDLNFATAGEILKITAGYRFGLDFFEAPEFQYANNFRHTISLVESFRFLPQTAIVHDTAFIVGDYWNPTGPVPAPTLVNDGYLLRTRVGLNGAFTSNFSVLALGGYAAGFFESPIGDYDQEYESFVAQLEARWQIVPQARLVFGYDRDFQPSFVGNFYRVDRGYANFQTTIGGAFLLGVEASFGGYEFGAVRLLRPGVVTSARMDLRFIGTLFAEYRFTEWLGVNGTVRYTGNFTDFNYQIDTGGAPIIDPAGYNKFEAWLGVRVFY